MRKALFVSLIAAAVAGCATLQAAGTRSTEKVLSAAGFSIQPADTAERVADLQKAPARRVVSEVRDGKTVYVYRDPEVCRCLYVGGEPQYQEYKRLQAKKDIAEEQLNRPEPIGFRGWGDGGWPWLGNPDPETQWP